MTTRCGCRILALATLLLVLETIRATATPTRETLGSPSSETIVLWHSLNTAQTQILSKTLKDFSNTTGIPVKLETGMELTRALVKQRRYGALPDVVWGAADLIAISREIDLSTVPKDLIPSSISPRFVSELSLNGSSLGVPILAGNHLVLYSNASIVPIPAKSWEEIIEQRAALNKKQIETLAIPVGEPYYFLPFMLHAGVFANGVLSPSLGQDWDKAAAAIKNYVTFIDAGVIPRNCSFTCVTDDFLKGKVAYAISGDWQFAENYAALGNNLRISKLPSLQGKPMKSISASQGLFFPGKSLTGPRRASLIKLVHHLLENEVQYHFAMDAGRIPVTIQAQNQLLRAEVSQEQKNLMEIFHDSQPLQSTDSTILTWLMIRKALIFEIQKVAPTSAIIDFLRARTAQQLASYQEESKR
jgi:maltose-binding protein MalE